MKYLIVGLGNIGPEYRDTRHNIGFMVVDALAKLNNTPFTSGRYGSTASFSIKGQQLLLLKPSTFMNLSGLAVRYWMQEEKIPLENVLIVVDDLALPFGTLRLKGKGSDAGHNGLKHIAATLGTQNYARLRFGIGNDFPRGGQIDYVLGHFTDEDWKTMDERLEMAGEIIKSFCLAGIDITVDGDYVDLHYRFEPVPFERIRRITGYLVGTRDRFNDAKRAEERDRVKHSV